MTDSPEKKTNLPLSETASRSQKSYYSLKDAPEFAGYKILEELPRGGQAQVYKALTRPPGPRLP